MKNLTAFAFVVLLVGCAANPGSQKTLQADRYRCNNDISFSVKFANDSAAIDSNRGFEMLYRTAGGLTPSQTVYISPRVRAEFGLGSTGREAILRYLFQPLVVRCVQQ